MVHIGIIKEILDDSRYIINVNVPNMYDLVKCYPLLYLCQPKIGDEVFMLELGKDLYVYIPIRTEVDDIKWTHKDHQIKMEDKGDLTVKSKSNIKIMSKKNISLEAEGKIKIANKEANLKNLLINMMMTYMKTETTLGGPLTPANVLDARNNITEIQKLFE